MNIYTPEIESQLIQYYQEDASQCLNVLKKFIDYTDELKDVLLEKELTHCKSKQDSYVESKGTPINFFTTLLRNGCIGTTNRVLTYLDSNKKNHHHEVNLNGRYWQGLLNRAKREYLLKTLINND